MMRVITGIARGRKLETLPGEDVTRPTTESVKEAVFSMIQFEIEDKNVLDLFAGSGQLGIEALSRGAKKCTFVENNKQAYNVIENNIKHCKLEQSARIVMSDACAFLSRRDSFDIAGTGILFYFLSKLAHMDINSVCHEVCILIPYVFKNSGAC